MLLPALTVLEITEALASGAPLPVFYAAAVPVVLVASTAFWLIARRFNRAQPVPVTQFVPMGPPVSRKQVTELRGPQPFLQEQDETGRTHKLRGSLIRIGRHGDNDIQLASPTVHRHHAVLHVTPQQKFVLTDLSGPEGNGVWVNGARAEHTELKPGDEIELGDVRMRFGMSETP